MAAALSFFKVVVDRHSGPMANVPSYSLSLEHARLIARTGRGQL
jgi:hypothetical protein